jgi:TolB-like protein
MGALGMRTRGMLVAMVAAAGLAGSCASSSPVLRSGVPITGRARVAVLPLEDLSGEATAAVGFTRMLYAELVRGGTCDVPETGVVEDAMDSLGIRNGGSLRRDQVKALGERLHVEYLLTGTLLESGMVRTGDGEVPSVGAALKLIEVATTRAVWAQVKFRTGEDRETVFGWGREKNPQILAGSLAHEMIADFTILTADSAAAKAGGKK